MTTGDEKTLNTSRQERFLKAVELLDSAHSYTRLGGVHALVALADEYLTDESLWRKKAHGGPAHRRCSLRLYPLPF